MPTFCHLIQLGHAYNFGMSSQVEELLEGVRSGRWLLPSPDEPNPVSLARAVSGICGGKDDWNDPVADQIRTAIGEPRHLIFVIADGFGMNFARRLPESSFVRGNLAFENRAAYPPITGANLFAFSRGEWAGQHGVIGWYVHLKELGERATLFPWIRTRDGKDLSDLGITPEDLYPGSPLVSGYSRSSITLIPSELAQSNPTRGLHGNSAVGYSDLNHAVDQAISHVSSNPETYTHIYWNSIDKHAHEFGCDDDRTLKQVYQLETELSRLRGGLPDDVRIVVTGDHGHSDIPDELKFVIPVDDEMQSLFEATPSGDNRTQIFRIALPNRNLFREKFLSRFGEHFFLFTTEEVLSLKLLGPDQPSDITVERLGDFMAIAKGGAIMKVLTLENQRPITEESEHGGFSPDEMLVPFVIG